MSPIFAGLFAIALADSGFSSTLVTETRLCGLGDVGNQTLGARFLHALLGSTATTAPTIQALPWASSRIYARIAEILLRERLGYAVQVIETQGGSLVGYQALAAGEADVNMELWPS